MTKQGALPDIWTSGHRNPLGAAINPGSQQLWSHEMGPKGGDEVNVIEGFRNYGWPTVSNGDNYDDSPIPTTRRALILRPPVHSWNPSVSPSGLIFYTGSGFPPWHATR